MESVDESFKTKESQNKALMFFSLFDKNDDGELDFDEFKTIVEAIEGLMNLDIEVFVKKLFEVADKDNSKTLDKEEVLNLFRKCGEDVSMKDIEEAFAFIDTDGNGVLDEEEFVSFFKKAFALLL